MLIKKIILSTSDKSVDNCLVANTSLLYSSWISQGMQTEPPNAMSFYLLLSKIRGQGATPPAAASMLKYEDV
jgi:hypothetical protein